MEGKAPPLKNIDAEEGVPLRRRVVDALKLEEQGVVRIRVCGAALAVAVP